MILLIAALVLTASPESSTPSRAGLGLYLESSFADCVCILSKEFGTEDQGCRDYLSEVSQEEDGEEEDGDSTDFWLIDWHLPSQTRKGLPFHGDLFGTRLGAALICCDFWSILRC